MSEWLKEHAWKSTLFARADAHEIPPTHFRSTTSRNIDTRRHVLVNQRVDRGFEGVCDTDTMKRLAAFVGGSFRATLRRRALRRTRGDQPWRMVPSTCTRKKARCAF